MKAELPYFKLDNRVKYAWATLIFLLDTSVACSERIAADLLHNRFVNGTGSATGTALVHMSSELASEERKRTPHPHTTNTHTRQAMVAKTSTSSTRSALSASE